MIPPAPQERELPNEQLTQNAHNVHSDALGSGGAQHTVWSGRSGGEYRCPGNIPSINVAKEPVDGFGALKAVLGAIAAVYADHKVRTCLPAKDPALKTCL